MRHNYSGHTYIGRNYNNYKGHNHLLSPSVLAAGAAAEYVVLTLSSVGIKRCWPQVLLRNALFANAGLARHIVFAIDISGSMAITAQAITI